MPPSWGGGAAFSGFPVTQISQVRRGDAARPADADVIIVGAGPSGMAAAVELAEAGCSVLVLDMQPAPGGQIYRAVEANFADEPLTDDLLATLGPSYAAGLALVRRFRSYRGGLRRWPAHASCPPSWAATLDVGRHRLGNCRGRRSSANRNSCCGWTRIPTSTLSTRPAAICRGPSPIFTGQPGFEGFPLPVAPVDPHNVCMMGIRSVDPCESG